MSLAAPRVLGTALATVAIIITAWWCRTQAIRAGSWDLAFLNAFPSAALGTLTAAGFWLIGRGWPVRIGEGESCAACGHQWVPEDDVMLNHCQECGAPWRWFGGRVRGHAASRPLQVWAGVLMLALVPAAITLDRLGAFAAFQRRSHVVMLRAVQSSQYAAAVDDFHRLQFLGVNDPAILVELAQAILRRREDGRVIPTEFIAWMHRGAVTGSLPQPVIDAWLGGMLDVDFDLAGVADAGSQISLKIIGTFANDWGGVADVPQIVMGPVTLEDGSTLAPAAANVVPAANLRGPTMLRDLELPAPSSPGAHTVRTKIWLFFGAPIAEVRFDVQQRPMLPAASLLYEFAWEGRVEIFQPGRR